MKYRIFNYSNTDFDIITENGGIASIYYNGDNYVSSYYQNNLNEINEDKDIWEELGSGKVYCKEWDAKYNKEEIIKDALNWLVVSSTPIEWELDNSLYNHIINN